MMLGGYPHPWMKNMTVSKRDLLSDDGDVLRKSRTNPTGDDSTDCMERGDRGAIQTVLGARKRGTIAEQDPIRKRRI